MNSLFADTEEWGQVFVIDSDALIDIKLEISVAEQWDVGVDIVRATENHKLLMPIQVHNEVVNVRHPDFPAPLASKVWSIIRGGANVRPSPRALRTVLATELSWIGMLGSEEEDIADPYVIALALDLKQVRHGETVAVVAHDNLVRSTCDSLELHCLELTEFLSHIRNNPSNHRG